MRPRFHEIGTFGPLTVGDDGSDIVIAWMDVVIGRLSVEVGMTLNEAIRQACVNADLNRLSSLGVAEEQSA